MNPINELNELLKLLKCKTPAEDIPEQQHNPVLKFLKQEVESRYKYRLNTLFRTCGITPKQMRTFEQFDWNFNPKVPKQDILAFRNSNWIDGAANLVMVGDTGIGKSHFGKALCHDALVKGIPAYFISTYDLATRIKNARHPALKIDYFGKTIKVLCLDEIGYTCHKKDDTDVIFQIISKRTELLPTIVTTNLPPKQWGSIFSGPAASALLDRLSFNGKFLTWEGKSYRKTKRK